jgi:hypothetical protein
MAAAFNIEPLIPATRMTAAANLRILRSRAAGRRLDLTNSQITAAIVAAMELDRIVNEHATRRSTQ